MTEPIHFAAFISYSSKDDKFARRLHRALETYHIPASLGEFDLIGGGKKNRIYPVFRDREELSAGDLGDRIEANLTSSAALIVVCSQHSAVSPWVQKEIEFFVKLGRRDRIFAIIPDNAPRFDEHGADGTHRCFPAAFRGSALAGGEALEPLAADARRGKDGFRNAWLKLVAGLLSVTPGQIINRDERQRRQRMVRSAAVWALVVFGGGYAYSQRATLEPMVIAYLQYKRFVDPSIQSAAPGTTFQDCAQGSTDCPLMVVLPAGEFLMGSPPEADDPENPGNEGPQRKISIARLAVSQNEITFADWQACLDAGGCNGYVPDRNGWEGNARPVINVSWEDAQHYVEWLSRMSGHEYRLLTEAEWEYAARAQTTADAPHTRYSWGNDYPVCQANALNGAAFAPACEQRSTWEVGSFAPNAFGLYDMHGNVWEWVQDCYAPNYDPEKLDGFAVQSAGLPQDERAPPSEACQKRVLRGASWDYLWQYLRSAYRNRDFPTKRVDIFGFRVARIL